MYMYSVIVYIIRMIVFWRMAVLCRVWSQCSASLVSLSDLQPLHPETRPSLHVHRQMHRLLQPSLLHLSHLLHLAGSHVCLHLLYGVCLDYTRRIFILQSHVFLFSIDPPLVWDVGFLHSHCMSTYPGLHSFLVDHYISLGMAFQAHHLQSHHPWKKAQYIHI